jgi:hypothetical protein
MAGKVFLSEYTCTSVRGMQAMAAPPLVVQLPILASGSSQSFNTFNGATEMVRISVDSGGPVCVRWGPNPTATINDERWAPNQTEARVVRPGDSVAVVVSPT